MTPTENDKNMHTDVLVVGAGPVGLTVANILAHYGVDFKIIDKESGPTDESRALWVQPRTMEYWAKIGLAEEATSRGKTITEFHPLAAGKPYGAVAFGGAGEGRTPFNSALILEQSKTERLLIGGLEKYGAEVEWETEMLDLLETESGATVTLRGPDDSRETVFASWVVGAGGASSDIRGILGLSFEGKTYERGFFVADVDMEWPLSHDNVYPEFARNGFLGFFPMPGGEERFRIVATLTPTLREKRDAGEEADLDDIQNALDELSGVDIKLTGARWISLYTVQQRMANHFRSTGAGRVFIAGDAAHTHSPAGGQGMNTGIGDAFNLGWKLALVVKGEARTTLLDSYEAERLPTARYILDKTDSLFSFEVTDNPLIDRVKMAVVPAILKLATATRMIDDLFFGFNSQINHNYPGSPAVEQAKKAPKQGPRAGDRAPYGLFGNGTDLYELLLGPEHHLLFFEGANSDFTRLAVARKEIEALLDRYETSFSIHRVSVENKQLHERYGVEAPGLFLIRPDGHIAYSGEGTDVVGLKIYLDRLFTPRELQSPKPSKDRPDENVWRLGPENSGIGFSGLLRATMKSTTLSPERGFRPK